MAINVELLRKVQAAILAEPEHFDMRTFGHKLGCETACCIAGWGVSIAHRRKLETIAKWNNSISPQQKAIEELAIEAFRLTDLQADELFFSHMWPAKFANRYRTANGDRRRAKIASDRIDAFIKQYAPEAA